MEEFRHDGLCVLRQLIGQAEIEAFREFIRRALIARLEALKAAHNPDGDLDSLLNDLNRVGQKEIMTVIRGVKNSVPFLQMMSHPRVTDLAKDLLGAKDLATVHDVALLRVDPPFDHERDFAWHQDYPYNMISNPAVTVWIPLTRVDASMGLMEYVPGSHNALVPVMHDAGYQNAPGSGNARLLFSLAEENVKGAKSIPVMEPGDVAAFHCLTLHRSGKNVSDRARWVLNFRYGNAADAQLVERGWKTVDDRDHGLFARVHSDYTRRPV
jgi:ectoine hydroxylase-related dioxygenase (phytanoyl-CoA dioxygenase family)